MRRFTFAGVPANSSGKTGGADQAPVALRDLGLVSAIDADDVGDLDTHIRGNKRDSDSRLVAFDGIIEATLVLRRRVGRLIEEGKTPFLCGGCSALLAGAFAGANDASPGRHGPGLAYVSGHMDLHDGDTAPAGHGDEMVLATLLGRGQRAWGLMLGDPAPLNPDDTILIGCRDREETEQRGALLPSDFQPHITDYGIGYIREHGTAMTGRAAAARLSGAPGSFWLHIDMSVLDEICFPATCALMPGGLDWNEVVALLRPLVTSSALAGLSVSGYSPDRDEGSSCGLHLVDMFRSLSH